MIEFFQEIFIYKFLSNAVIACILIGISSGIIGTYIVCRRLVFMSGGITHASFGGIGIAYYLGLNPIWGALVFAVASAMGMEAMTDRIKIREDSAIGILWSLGMAVGIIFVFLTPGYAPNLMSFLFGNILTITQTDIVCMIILNIILLITIALMYRPILYISFDRSYSSTQGVPVKTINYLMMILTAAAIVFSIRLAGIVLLISLLTIPPVTVNTLTRSFKKIMIFSVIIATLGTFFGLFISYKTNLPSGASTIFVLTLTLIVVKIVSFFIKKSVNSQPK